MLTFLFQFLVYCTYLCRWLCKIWRRFSQASVKYENRFCVFSGLCEVWRLFLCLFRPLWIMKAVSVSFQASVNYEDCFCVFLGLCEIWRLFLCLFRPLKYEDCFCVFSGLWSMKIVFVSFQASVKYEGCFCVFSGLCELWRLFLCLFRPPNPIEYLAAFLLKNKSQYEWMIIIVSLLSSLVCFHFGLFLHISLFSSIASDITKSAELCKNETWEWLESAQISGCSGFC